MGMRETLERRIERWLADPDSSVEYAEEVESRWAVRMRQEARDATTVWFTIGQRSLEYEAYVMPAAEGGRELYGQALHRNMKGWRTHYALDQEGGLVRAGPSSRMSPTSARSGARRDLRRDRGRLLAMLRSLIAGRENSG